MAETLGEGGAVGEQPDQVYMRADHSVRAVWPSSARTRGAIVADGARRERLWGSSGAYVRHFYRPSCPQSPASR